LENGGGKKRKRKKKKVEKGTREICFFKVVRTGEFVGDRRVVLALFRVVSRGEAGGGTGGSVIEGEIAERQEEGTISGDVHRTFQRGLGKFSTMCLEKTWGEGGGSGG